MEAIFSNNRKDDSSVKFLSAMQETEGAKEVHTRLIFAEFSDVLEKPRTILVGIIDIFDSTAEFQREIVITQSFIFFPSSVQNLKSIFWRSIESLLMTES